MRQAYSLLGLTTLIVFMGAYLAFDKVHAPAPETVIENTPMSLSLTSTSFKEGESIPSKFTCDGEGVSPELMIGNVPKGTQSLVLVMDDPDIPESVKTSRGIQKFDHWVLYNIPADTTVIKEGESVGTVGLNSRGEATYVPPCPPDREHRYLFRFYAVTGTLNFIKAPTLDEVEMAAKGMMLEETTLVGRYVRTTP